MSKRVPPKYFLRFFRWFCHPDFVEDIEGDLLERFEKRKESGKAAKLSFVKDVLQLFRPGIIKPMEGTTKLNNYAMFKHHIKLVWRNLTQQKVFSSIKIGGFSLGIAACILISLFIIDEQSFDKHYKDQDRIFRLAKVDKSDVPNDKWTIMQAPVRNILYETFPEIEKVSRLVVRDWHNAGDNQFRRIDNKQNVYEEGFIYADHEFLEILEIPMIYGNQRNALEEPNTIVLSKSKAEKYFPNENPVGKQVLLNDSKTMTIGGVMDDFPSTSHLNYDFIITLTDVEFWKGEQTSWCCNNYEYYVKLKPDTDKHELEQKLLYIRDTYVVPQLLAEGSVEAEEIKENRSYYLQPVQNIYLSPDEVGDMLPKHGIVDVIWLLGIIAIIILALAIINFVNLSTAKSSNRAKEVGLRKVIGSNRGNLIAQYLSESAFYSFVSILVGALLAWLVLPIFNTLVEKILVFPWFEWWFLPSLLGLVLVIGLIAGFYPAIYLSSFKPIAALKGKLGAGNKSSGFRSGLVIFQFTISIVLIISALVVNDQVKYFLTKDLGFDKDQVIVIQSAETMSKDQLAFKNELLTHADIQNVTISDYMPIPGTAENNNLFWNEGRKELDQGTYTRIWRVDYDYINTLGMNLSKGRSFSRTNTTDESAIIINQRMADQLGLENPIGANIDGVDKTRKVIGVVDDFHFESLAFPIQPLCLLLGKSGSNIIVKAQSKDMRQTLASVESVWDEFMPNQLIRYSFLDKRFIKTFTNEILRRIKLIFLIFAGLAIFIACLGLLGLSAFTMEQRSKEVSIRKVLGASLSSIFSLLTSNFIKLVLIAMVIAMPIGWYFMSWFLEEFTYRIEMTWTVFALAGLSAIFIAIVAIMGEVLKTASSNPAETLRNE